MQNTRNEPQVGRMREMALSYKTISSCITLHDDRVGSSTFFGERKFGQGKTNRRAKFSSLSQKSSLSLDQKFRPTNSFA